MSNFLFFSINTVRKITKYNFILPVIFCILVSLPILQGSVFAENVASTVTIRPDPPEITSITASDSANNAGYSNDDTITVRFSGSTNTPPVASKSQIDAVFLFSQSLGTNYSGVFTNPSTLVITVLDSTNNGNPVIGTFTVTVKAGGGLKNSAGTSLASTSQSPVLTGSFGTRAGPYITDFVVDDPDNTSSLYSNGDTITIRFSEPTNTPGTGVQSKTAVNNLFSFSDVLGNNYSGQWINSLTFKITVSDIASGNPRIGITTVQPNGTTQIKNSAGTSSPSTGTSSVLSGSFGVFTVTQIVEQGESAISTLPSGIMSEIQLPSDSAGEITIEKVEITNNAVPTGTIDFIGDVIDLSLDSGASCTSGCTISFTFTANDLPSGSSTSSVKLFHDANDDGDFGDAGEQLSTTITESPPGTFTASATTNSNSNFGIGIIHLTPAPTPSNPAPSSGTHSSGGGGGGGHGGSSTSTKTSSKSSDSGTTTKGFGGKLVKDGTDQESAPVQPSLPARIRNVAEWWSAGKISEKYFVQNIGFLVQEKIIKLDETKNLKQPQKTPSWVKNVAEWWSAGKISNLEFVHSMQWLVNNGIIPYK